MALERDPQTGFAHVSAIVEDGAVLGANTKVWHQAHVRAGAVIGSDCVLGKNVFVDAGVTIGDRCKIQNNVSVYNGVELADDVFVGPGAVFTNDLRPRAANSVWSITPTHVATGASIGANATIVCGNVIDRNAMIAAGSVVTRSVSAHQLVGGNPARHLGWVCECGTVVSRAPTVPADLRCPLHGGPPSTKEAS